MGRNPLLGRGFLCVRGLGRERGCIQPFVQEMQYSIHTLLLAMLGQHRMLLTRKLNGGLNGLPDRRLQLVDWKAELGVS